MSLGYLIDRWPVVITHNYTISYQITNYLSLHLNSCATMPINTTELDAAIRKVLAISHLEIIDQSSGCGDNYAVLLVSDVSL